VMSDNGSCHRSKNFAAALGPEVKHRRTRPQPTPDQRKGGTVQPNPLGRVGLRPELRVRRRTRSHL
jgi:hypothetical protein